MAGEENEWLSAHLKRWRKRYLFGFALILFLTTLIFVWRLGHQELAKFIAYLLGGGMLLWQVAVSSRRAEAMEKAVALTEKGNTAERFKNAIEHLGHKSVSVHLGGVYALHHVAWDVEDYRWPVRDILCSNIREITTQKDYKPRVTTIAESATIHNKSRSLVIVRPTIEIETILSVLFSKAYHKVYQDLFPNLESANLQGARLFDADLRRANFFNTNLQQVMFGNADLRGALLNFANLQDAYLTRANLQGAHLTSANLQGTYLQGTNLTKAKDLTIEQLLHAKTLYKAQLPVGMEEEIRQRKPELFDNPYP